ncbi:hypothetical protein [Pandoraea sp. ISTKB]|uniref:hypothetical protein n=1 Tax=Pandoraea sp. ISTKB TaxID=1586708 RepID=UPI00147C9135|nr:hypothetical protein [Pandoraea sp. ISTKB]
MRAVERPPVIVGKIQRRRHPGMGVGHDIRTRIEGIVRGGGDARMALTCLVGVATAEKRPRALDEDDVDRRRPVAGVLLEKLPVRFDGGFDRAQHHDLSTNAIRFDSQCDVGPYDGNRGVLEAIDGGAKRSARQDDGICLGRQCQKTMARFGLHLRRHRPRTLHRLAKRRPKFMSQVFLCNAKTFGRVLEQALVALDRV